MHKKTIRVVHFHRRPEGFTFSIERMMETIREHLPPHIQCAKAVSRFINRRFLPRMYNIVEAACRQKDVNHITSSGRTLTCLLKKKRTVMTILDCGSLVRPHGLNKRFYLLYRLFFWVIPIKRCSYLTAISEKTREEVLTLLSCDPARIRVIHVPVSCDFKCSPREFNTQRPVILQVRTAENKNIRRVAAALNGLCCHFRIVGELSPEQRRVLDDNSIDYSNVCGISNAEMVIEYINCDMLVFASTYEGFGMPIIEANAVGRPVVTSHIAPMPEVAGDAACLVDPWDVESIRRGIVRIIEDSQYRDDLVARGYENVKRFAPLAIAVQYAELYEEIHHEASLGRS